MTEGKIFALFAAVINDRKNISSSRAVLEETFQQTKNDTSFVFNSLQ
jgi:hypothetical protein